MAGLHTRDAARITGQRFEQATYRERTWLMPKRGLPTAECMHVNGDAVLWLSESEYRRR